MNPDVRKKWLIATAVTVVALFVADRFVLTPLASVWTGRSERIAELRGQVTEAQSLVERAGELERRWKEMIDESLPENKGDAEGFVLNKVSEWASGAGVEMSALKPRWRQDADPPTLECSASGTGSMAQISKFLYALETGPAALRVEDIGLSAEDEKGSKLRMELRFTGVILRGAES